MPTPDFSFAFESADAPAGPWSHLQVVRFSGHEELSHLYRYDLTLLAKHPASSIDPHDLVGARATLRIATLTTPDYKLLHGVIAEASELAEVPDGYLYRVLLLPPLIRAAHRTRCRIFLAKTTRQVIDAVLQGDPLLTRDDTATVPADDGDPTTFTPADETYAWRISDPSRIDDVTVRPYCVQYNESDLAFVARLLEEEGITYHFENGANLCLLVLADADRGRTRIDPFDAFGNDVPGRAINTYKLGARLREKTVRLRDYDWRKPALDLGAEARGNENDLFEYRYPGGFSSDAPMQGSPLAKSRLERYGAEARFATGNGTCRAISAGTILRVDLPHMRHDGEVLITKLETQATQAGVVSVEATQGALPFTCAFECVPRGTPGKPDESNFRPARVTPRPRIIGSQTAFVTADPSNANAEIQVGGPPGNEIGCVRLRFHWDLEAARLAQEPSSCWVRVSQVFAGLGEGGVWHPRVGVEAIVEFIDGDPDRPIVTGRVYNGANRPPAPASGAATVSMMKSFSSPGGKVSNEFSFDDTAGKEQVKIHAGKNMDSTVGHDRSEKVANNSTSDVTVDRTESTGASRSTSVTANNAETVGGDESVFVTGNQSITVLVNQLTTVGVNQTTGVGASQTTTVGASRSTTVTVADGLIVGGNRDVAVAGNLGESIVGNVSLQVGGTMEEAVTGPLTQTVTAAIERSSAASVKDSAGVNFTTSAGAKLEAKAGTDMSLIAGALAVLEGANVHISASGEITLGAGGSAIKISGAGVEISGSSIKLAGGSVDISGSVVKVN